MILSLQDRVLGFTRACTSAIDQSWTVFRGGSMDIQHLSRISSDITAIVSGFKNRRGGEHHQSLSVCIRILQRLVSVQLGLPLLRRGSLRFDCHSRRTGADSSILWLLLPLYYQSTEGQEITTTCLASVKSIILLYRRKVRMPVFGIIGPR